MTAQQPAPTQVAGRTDLRPAARVDLPSAVTAELVGFFARRRPDAVRVSPRYAEAVDALETFVTDGGKRVRPAFAWWGWVGAGGDPGGETAPAALRAFAALELIQACALVHDDLMDDSDTRRGNPTVHVAFADRHRAHGWRGDPVRFGTAAALLLGDVAMAWADDLLRASGLPAAALARAEPVWEAMRLEVLGGQYLDVLADAAGDESPEAALRIDRFKTAAYTVERPLHLGAAVAGADADLVAAYRSFGTDIGTAFQLRDDLLGVFGDPAVTGKPAGDDLREGKHTLLVALALQRADAADPAAARLLRSGLGTALDAAGIDRLRAALLDLGAVDEVEARITELADRAAATLAVAPVTEPARDALARMARSATSRTH
ncbi:polyprenyl synthetase family protein [Rhodococcus aerolatus]